MLELYPATQAHTRHDLAVGDGHTLRIEQYGRTDGVPVLFVHGGPGAGSSAQQARYFDPARYLVVLFDQRGCGASTPHASLHQNTTAHLINDIERIREHLGIERWVVFGGSWGSTLSLAYAQQFPDRVLGLILRGVFLGRSRDIRWFYEDGASRVFPEHWREFVKPIPPDERNELLAAYHRRLTGDDELARMGAAKAWSVWEGRTATLRPDPALVNHFADPFVALALARIECHYFANDCFLEPGQILRDAARLHGIPGTIVHGRYDMVCTIDQADALAQAWPDADLIIVPDAGHAAREPGIVDALVRATRKMVDTVDSARTSR